MSGTLARSAGAAGGVEPKDASSKRMGVAPRPLPRETTRRDAPSEKLDRNHASSTATAMGVVARPQLKLGRSSVRR